MFPLTEQEGSGNGYRLEGNRPARASPSRSSVFRPSHQQSADSPPSDHYRRSAAAFSTSSAQIFLATASEPEAAGVCSRRAAPRAAALRRRAEPPAEEQPRPTEAVNGSQRREGRGGRRQPRGADLHSLIFHLLPERTRCSPTVLLPRNSARSLSAVVRLQSPSSSKSSDSSALSPFGTAGAARSRAPSQQHGRQAPATGAERLQRFAQRQLRRLWLAPLPRSPPRNLPLAVTPSAGQDSPSERRLAARVAEPPPEDSPERPQLVRAEDGRSPAQQRRRGFSEPLGTRASRGEPSPVAACIPSADQ